MRTKSGVRGVTTVRRNLTRQMGKKRIASVKGLLMAATYIRLDMDTTIPLIPVKTGALRASWFVQPTVTPGGPPFVTMGFTAAHAIFAHEMDWEEGTRPGSGPKFFQSALNRNKRKITKIIASQMI